MESGIQATESTVTAMDQLIGNTTAVFQDLQEVIKPVVDAFDSLKSALGPIGDIIGAVVGGFQALIG